MVSRILCFPVKFSFVVEKMMSKSCICMRMREGEDTQRDRVNPERIEREREMCMEGMMSS